MALTGGALLRITQAYARGDGLVRRTADRVRRIAGAFLSGALVPAERAQLSYRLYDISDAGKLEQLDLFGWERSWFPSRLPNAPARILVAAAGSGREAQHLAGLGYRVDAFEPSARRGALCKRRIDTAGTVSIASYKDWFRAVLMAEHNSAHPVSGSYDAVLLGWGSLSHVLDADARGDVIRAADRVSPNGPILASFWLGTRGSRGASRVERWAGSVGSSVGRLRGAGPPLDAEFTPWGGFTVAIERDEIEAHARRVGRRVAWDHGDADTPHATFLPTREPQ